MGKIRHPGEDLFYEALLSLETEEDLRLFAKLLWLECRGESYEGQQAVAEVILNRLVSPDYPDTIRGIVYADGQFPCTDDIPTATPTQTQYEAIEAALNHAKTVKGQPSAIVMKTTKGKGVSFMENDAGWHGKGPNDAECETAMNELRAALAELEAE